MKAFLFHFLNLPVSSNHQSNHLIGSRVRIKELRQGLLLLLRIRSSHLKVLGFPIGGVYYTLFFCIRTANFGAEAERSYIFWRFEAENVLKMFLNYIVQTICILVNHRTRPGNWSKCIAC